MIENYLVHNDISFQNSKKILRVSFCRFFRLLLETVGILRTKLHTAFASTGKKQGCYQSLGKMPSERFFRMITMLNLDTMVIFQMWYYIKSAMTPLPWERLETIC